MNSGIIIQSLSMDLLRAAVGSHRGSQNMAARFKQEALKRIEELETAGIASPYLNNLTFKAKASLLDTDPDTADDLLMYSVLFQNYSTAKLRT